MAFSTAKAQQAMIQKIIRQEAALAASKEHLEALRALEKIENKK